MPLFGDCYTNVYGAKRINNVVPISSDHNESQDIVKSTEQLKFDEKSSQPKVLFKNLKIEDIAIALKHSLYPYYPSLYESY